MGPSGLVARELLRAVGALVAAPLHLAIYLVSRRRLAREFLADLATQAAPQDPGPPSRSRFVDRGPLTIFLSCAEPSGELHALHWIEAVETELAELGAPAPRWIGLGGEALERVGVRRVGDPVQRAAMGFGVLAALPFYLRLLRDAARALRDERPDLVLCVDSPALHVPLGSMARALGLKVVHFATPQYWGWAPWRVGGYRRAVSLALTILPFEPSWFARHRVPAVHVGHPLLDALADVPPGSPDPASQTLVLLPGSRAGVVARNLPWMLALVARWRERHPEVRVLLPHDLEKRRAQMRELVRAAGASAFAECTDEPLHSVLPRARAALSVSGTVLLDLLHHRLPAVVVYRVAGPVSSFAARHVLTVPAFAATNLLAGAEVAPEFCFHGEGPEQAVREALDRLWEDGEARRGALRGLERAAARLGPGGATRRAARWALSLVESQPPLS